LEEFKEVINVEVVVWEGGATRAETPFIGLLIIVRM
jgi:hypothetical protein